MKASLNEQETLSSEEGKKAAKPKKLIAFGIHAHGTVAVGISAHGVVALGVLSHGIVSIGVITMGVFSAGLVSMGLLSSGLVAMGLRSFGPQSMQLGEPHHHGGHGGHSSLGLPGREGANPQQIGSVSAEGSTAGRSHAEVAHSEHVIHQGH